MPTNHPNLTFYMSLCNKITSLKFSIMGIQFFFSLHDRLFKMVKPANGPKTHTKELP